MGTTGLSSRAVLKTPSLKEKIAIGIDVGGSFLKWGIVTKNGNLLHNGTEKVHKEAGESGVILQITACIQLAAGTALQLGKTITGIGIGFPGIVDNNVIIGGADNLPGFNNLALGLELERSTSYPVFIDNDANMMGLAEWSYGAAKGCSDVVFLTVGTGIGGALIINNRLYGGYKNRGTELGHIIIRQGGLPCSCGGVGCLEAYGSVTALLNLYRSIRGPQTDNLDGKYIVNRYLQDEAAATQALHQHFDALATGIAGLINIFSPQKVVIGGGISEAGDFYVREIATRTAKIAMASAASQTAIVRATLGNKAGLQGSAAKVFQLTTSQAYLGTPVFKQ